MASQKLKLSWKVHQIKAYSKHVSRLSHLFIVQYLKGWTVSYCLYKFQEIITFYHDSMTILISMFGQNMPQYSFTNKYSDSNWQLKRKIKHYTYLLMHR